MNQLTLFSGPCTTEEEIHAAIEPLLIQVLEENNVPHHHLSFSHRRGYSSCVYKASQADEENTIRGGVIYRICMRGQKHYISVKERYSSLIQNEKTSCSISDGYIKVHLCEGEDALKFAPLFTKILEESIESAPKEFDCCSRFEVCSDARKCIHPDPEFSLIVIVLEKAK